MGLMLLLFVFFSCSMWACNRLQFLVSVASSPCNYSAQICGNFSIPYPFGMSSECGLPAYRISCKSTDDTGKTPFLQVGTSYTPELQVLNFANASITVNSTALKAMPTSADCRSERDAVIRVELPKSGPFVVSDGNIFAVIGCDSSGSCTSDRDFNVQCSAGCYNQHDFEFCNNYACCNNLIPPGSRYLEFTGNGISYATFPDLCGFSTVLDPSTYRNPDPRRGAIGDGQYGMSIAWALILNHGENCSTAPNRSDYACAEHGGCVDNLIVPGYTCNCNKHGFRGDGYTHGLGCEDIDECMKGTHNCKPPLGICTNTVGSYDCSCMSGFKGDGRKDGRGCEDIDECEEGQHVCEPTPRGICTNTVGSYNCSCMKGFKGDGRKDGFGCEDIDECKEGSNTCDPPPLGICTNTVGNFNCSCANGTRGFGTRGTCVVDVDVVLPTVLGGLAGALALAILASILFMTGRAYRRRQQREENFHRNGGAELRSILFSEDELKRIINNFSHEHELGKGGYGTVYWGKLPTSSCKLVAIKKAKHMEDEEREEQQMKSFVSEILLLGKTTHENVVRLLGCCVETRVPLLVYEFVENGTLWDHLHLGGSEPSISSSLLSRSWARRLDIAVGTAKAVSVGIRVCLPQTSLIHTEIEMAHTERERETTTTD